MKKAILVVTVLSIGAVIPIIHKYMDAKREQRMVDMTDTWFAMFGNR